MAFQMHPTPFLTQQSAEAAGRQLAGDGKFEVRSERYVIQIPGPVGMQDLQPELRYFVFY